MWKVDRRWGVVYHSDQSYNLVGVKVWVDVHVTGSVGAISKLFISYNILIP